MTQVFLVGVYAAAIALLAPFALHRVWMLIRFRRWGPEPPTRLGRDEPPPTVTLQLPIYNEAAVVERLFAAVRELDYPRDRIDVQVLDDSTDETKGLVDAGAARLSEAGLRTTVVRRSNRSGFKAGALEHALPSAQGELIALLDADFTPAPGFLRDLVGAFADPSVALVQARWGHANRDHSWLTRAQGTLIDGHFVLEHSVRHAAGLFFNFNGTAGIWRRAAIEAAGGWSADTLTEDLDLSFRAQLAGWRLVYAPAVEAPAELPQGMLALKAQQFRWVKGTTQVLRKLGPSVARCERSLATRLDALGHLASPFAHPCVLTVGLLLPLVSSVRARLPVHLDMALLALGIASVFVFYGRAQLALGRGPHRVAGDVVSAVTLGLGLSLSQTTAVVQGLFGGVGEFERTPKWGTQRVSSYVAKTAVPAGAELVLAAWSGLGCCWALRDGRFGSLPFLALFTLGFTWVGVHSRLASTR